MYERGRGCQKPSMKMSQQLCFHFQCFLLYSALSQFRSPGIPCPICPRVCPASLPNIPWPRGARGRMLCAQCPATDTGSLMHTACSSAARMEQQPEPRPASARQLPTSSRVTHLPVPLALDCKGEAQHKGNIIPVWSLPGNSLLLPFCMLRTAQLG